MSKARDAGTRKIFHKKDLVEAVKGMNRRNRGQRIKASKVAHTPAPILPSLDVPIKKRSKTQVEMMQQELHAIARRYNELKQQAEQKAHLQEELENDLRVLKMENQSLRRIENHETTETHHLDELEASIERVTKSLERKLFPTRSAHFMKRMISTPPCSSRSKH